MSDVMGTPILGVPVTRDSLNGVKNTANTIQIHKVIENKILYQMVSQTIYGCQRGKFS